MDSEGIYCGYVPMERDGVRTGSLFVIIAESAEAARAVLLSAPAIDPENRVTGEPIVMRVGDDLVRRAAALAS
jgi:hypothetical protein